VAASRQGDDEGGSEDVSEGGKGDGLVVDCFAVELDFREFAYPSKEPSCSEGRASIFFCCEREAQDVCTHTTRPELWTRHATLDLAAGSG
jgi:hypothetical protein